MIRLSKIVLGLAVVLSAGAIVLAYAGLAEPHLTGSQIPGTPYHGFAAIVVMVVGAGFLSAYLDLRAWRRTGRRAGFSPDGRFKLFANPPDGDFQIVELPDLTGTVRGRPVRARASTVDSRYEGEPAKLYAVVETDLDTPVEWHATFFPGSGETSSSEFPELGPMQWTTIDGEFAVWGDVSEDIAREVLSHRVRNVLSTLGSHVTVGDMAQNTLGAMLGSIPDDAGSASASLARGMLGAGHQPERAESSTEVMHREEGLLLDGDELKRRAEAVAAVAEAVERTTPVAKA